MSREPQFPSVHAAASAEKAWFERLVTACDALRARRAVRDWLAATAHHWRYSPQNAALIHLQRPRARYVAGRRAWAARGRAVRPDATPIWVLAPGGGRRFLGVLVYDVRDTDGPPLVPPRFGLRGAAPRLATLRRAATALGVTVRPLPASLEGLAGRALPGRVVEVSHRVPPAEQAATLAHELAHVLLGHPEQVAFFGRSSTSMEAEAEGAAFIVCGVLGLKSRAPEYLAFQGLSSVALRRAFHSIARAAREILHACQVRPRRRSKGAGHGDEA
jgi:hypothetical protein